jgi:cysteine synthase B
MGHMYNRLTLVRPILGQNLLDRIGDTPLVRMPRLTAGLRHVQVVAKAEWYNPGGSVKDRAAANIVREARRDGRLAHGKTLLDSTSGNTGIAYAMLGAALGFPVKLCVPDNVSPERKRILRAYGADIVFTDPGEGSDGALLRAREMYQEDPRRYFYADQYGNDDNWRAHYNTTGPEIWEQTDGTVTHFVAMLGTSGTFVGTSRRLKEINPRIRCISLQPDSPFHGIEGAKHMPSAIVPAIYDASVVDENIEIRTEDAYDMARRLAREEGLLVGISGAAAMVGAMKVAHRVEQSGHEGVIVAIFPDSADKYLSERFWEELADDFQI